jgi:membrane-associated phospholipid phosphatase
MFRRFLLAQLFLMSSWAFAQSTQSWDKFSTVLAIGAPLSATAQSWLRNDDDGIKDLALSVWGTLVVDEVIKNQHKEMRPDGSGDDSFPSNHTAVAMATARYVDIRYGDSSAYWYYGTSLLTAYARVAAQKHYWRDNYMGAGVGFLMAGVATDPRSAKTYLQPVKGGWSLGWQKPL